MDHVIVVGVGGMGSAAACHLAARGASVLALDRFGIPNDLGSSHGLSRIIRLAYWEHPAYVPAVRRAYALWREAEAASGHGAAVVTGFDQRRLTRQRQRRRRARGLRGVRHAVRRTGRDRAGGAISRLSPACRSRLDYQPAGGLLRPEACVAAHAGAARRYGADVRANQRVLEWHADERDVRVRTEDGEYRAAHLVSHLWRLDRGAAAVNAVGPRTRTSGDALDKASAPRLFRCRKVSGVLRQRSGGERSTAFQTTTAQASRSVAIITAASGSIPTR